MKIVQSNNSRHTLTLHAVTKLLTCASQQLDDGVVSALRRAHGVAMERQLLKKPVFVLDTQEGAHWLVPHSVHQWAAMAILFVMIIFSGINGWQHAQRYDLSHLDVEILVDDMPLEIFIDDYQYVE
jgi:hypothetical protein